LQELGVDILLELPFTRELATMTASAFLDALCGACKVAGISVGSNWHFGKAGAGNADFLRTEAAQRGFRACVADMLTSGQDVVCSTRIRALLSEGKTAQAADMLGRPFSVYGTVEHGQKLARKLGFPTANIALPSSAALPCPGVYSVSATIKGQLCHGIANVGLRPTIQENIKITRLEAHFTDWNNGNFYGESIEVFLHSFIRKEQKFSSIEALKAQIEEDLNHLKH
jgi:riboflavin kinase/FMN adenylyltransferase